MDKLTVTLVQYAPEWENIDTNLDRLTRMIRPFSGQTDLIVLPEMFPTGFSMNVGAITGKTEGILSWMRDQAKSTGAMIAGSMAVYDQGEYYNRFFAVGAEGEQEYYDKHHLFSMSDEPRYFKAGTRQTQFRFSGWVIRPVICYDLRFPVWCRNHFAEPYDLLLCPASWPAVRKDAWLSLLKARALENQCYVAGVNRTGEDGNGLAHQGDSVVFGPRGEIIGKLEENKENTDSFTLSKQDLSAFRKKFPVLKDMDEFRIGSNGFL